MGFTELANLFYANTGSTQTLKWTETEALKKAVESALALVLQDITKPFHLYVNEARGIP